MPLEISGVRVGVAIAAGWCTGWRPKASFLIELQAAATGESDGKAGAVGSNTFTETVRSLDPSLTSTPMRDPSSSISFLGSRPFSFIFFL